jgi:hypothetical protein
MTTIKLIQTTTTAAVLLIIAVPHVVQAGESSGDLRRPSEPQARARTSVAPKFTPEERQKRRQQIKERLNRQVSELQKRKRAGTLSEEDGKRLQRLELLAARFERRPELPPSTAFGAPSNHSAAEKAPAKKIDK